LKLPPEQIIEIEEYAKTHRKITISCCGELINMGLKMVNKKRGE